MDELWTLRTYKLFVVEDAAQGVMSTLQRTALGTIGHLGCCSFHETKNIIVRRRRGAPHQRRTLFRAGRIRPGEGDGPSSKFYRGEVDKYTWVDIGSSFLPSELNAAYLYAQLRHADEIQNDRLNSWQAYDRQLQPLAEAEAIEQPVVPPECEHNGHMYYIKAKDRERTGAPSGVDEKNAARWGPFTTFRCT